jgi:hypothetical protein
VVTKRYRALGATDYDVCVAGGTLGVFLALALQVGCVQGLQSLPEHQCTAGCASIRLLYQTTPRWLTCDNGKCADERPPRVHRGAASG